MTISHVPGAHKTSTSKTLVHYMSTNGPDAILLFNARACMSWKIKSYTHHRSLLYVDYMKLPMNE